MRRLASTSVMVALTGGVGSGKSTVARLLADHGALVIDADTLAREVVEPGTPGFDAVEAHFGPDVVDADGTLNRAALARIVFADPDQRDALNAIVHPRVGARMAELAEQAPADAIVLYDVPLLTENRMSSKFEAVLVVETPADLRVRRLAERGMSEQDARARMAAQATDAQRREIADELIMNDGSLTDLRERVEAAWERLHGGQAPRRPV